MRRVDGSRRDHQIELYSDSLLKVALLAERGEEKRIKRMTYNKTGEYI